MTAWIVIGIIFLVILLFLLIRVGCRAVYSEEGFFLYLKVLFLSFKLLPGKTLTVSEETAKKEKQKRNKEKKKAKKALKAEKNKARAQKKKPASGRKKGTSAKKKGEQAQKKKSPGDLLWLLQLVGPALHALSSLRRKLCVSHLEVHYAIGGAGDPAAAAVTYGRISAGGGALFPVLNTALDVRDWDLDISVDFQSESASVYLDAQATYRIGQLLGIVLSLGWKALLAYLNKNKDKDKDKDKKPEAALTNHNNHKKRPEEGGTEHGTEASAR